MSTARPADRERVLIGGAGTFLEYMPPAGVDGHQIVTRPGLWTPALEAYLKRQGLPFSPAPP